MVIVEAGIGGAGQANDRPAHPLRQATGAGAPAMSPFTQLEITLTRCSSF
jgi:hypothetical protein